METYFEPKCREVVDNVMKGVAVRDWAYQKANTVSLSVGATLPLLPPLRMYLHPRH